MSLTLNTCRTSGVLRVFKNLDKTDGTHADIVLLYCTLSEILSGLKLMKYLRLDDGPCK